MKAITLILLFSVTSLISCASKEQWRIRLVTFNVKDLDLKGDINLRPLFGLDDPERADIIAVGFQELPSSLISVIKKKDSWGDEVKDVLRRNGYSKVASELMIGIGLRVFVRSEIFNEVSHIEVDHKKTGFGGLYGNKGGVAASFMIRDTSVVIVNSHLAAHLEKVTDRYDDYRQISKKLWFRKASLDGHDLIIWMGDLNFRIDDLATDEVAARLAEGAQSPKVTDMLLYDQLNKAKKEGIVFESYTEAPITFLPSYKFNPGTDDYDLSRKPAWTDRILYRKNSDNIEVWCNLYKSFPEYKQSDHKPVSAIIMVNKQETFY